MTPILLVRIVRLEKLKYLCLHFRACSGVKVSWYNNTMLILSIQINLMEMVTSSQRNKIHLTFEN